MNDSGLRPSGTVEVCCSHPGCGIAWWVNPLDPRLPEGPFDCGSDHTADRALRTAFARLRLRHGIVDGVTVSHVAMPASTDGGCRMSFRKGFALVRDRDCLKQGYLAWEDPAELADVDAAAARIEWDRAKWPEEARSHPGAAEREKSPAGLEHWVPFVRYLAQGEGRPRRYVFVPCARPGCGHEVMVDAHRPDFRPQGYSVGAWGGGFMPKPEWWGRRTFLCEDGLSSASRVPCRLRTSEALADIESRLDIRWTVWGLLDGSGSRGTILFTPNVPSAAIWLLAYRDEAIFLSPVEMRMAMLIDTVAGHRARLARLRGDKRDDALFILRDAIGDQS